MGMELRRRGDFSGAFTLPIALEATISMPIGVTATRRFEMELSPFNRESSVQLFGMMPAVFGITIEPSASGVLTVGLGSGEVALTLNCAAVLNVGRDASSRSQSASL